VIIQSQLAAAYWYDEARKRLALELKAGVTNHAWSEDAQKTARHQSKIARSYLGIED
jgi:hypothetical protein